MYFDLQLWRLTRGPARTHRARGRARPAALAAGIARFAFLGWFLALVFQGAPSAQLALPLAGVAGGDRAARARSSTRARCSRIAPPRASRRRCARGSSTRSSRWDRAGSRPSAPAASCCRWSTASSSCRRSSASTCRSSSSPRCAPFAIFAFMMWWDVPVASVMLAAAIFTLILPELSSIAGTARAAIARQKAFKAFGEEFLDAMQGLPTLKAFGQSKALRPHARARRRGRFPTSTMWVLGAEHPHARRHRSRHGARRRVGARAGRVSRDARRDEHGSAAGRADGRHRDLPAAARPAHGAAPGHDRAVGRRGHPRAARRAEARRRRAGRRPARDRPAARRIAFEDVRFAYPGGRDAAHRRPDVSRSRRASASASSARAARASRRSCACCCGSYDPQAGAVRIGGHDLRELDPEAVAAQIAVVAQDTYLFYGTIEDNLRLGRPDATCAEVEAAARTANAHDFITALPDGYATVIGERGTRLSGGQRQRLAIARARAARRADPDPRRGAVVGRRRERGGDPAGARPADAGPHDADPRASPVERDRRRPHPGARARARRRKRPPRRADAPRRAVSPPDGVAGARRTTTRSRRARSPAARDRRARDRRQRRGAARDARRSRATSAPTRPTVGWRDTMLTLLRFIRPVVAAARARPSRSGIGRVAAFIGVGVLGALVIAAVKGGAWPQSLIVALLVVAPLAGLLHWLESWLAHDMAYRLLAEMRIDSIRKLEALAPAYLLERRSGDLLALSTQDVETVEYFFAHTVAPAFVAVLVPGAVLATLGVTAWPLALVLLPFLAYAGLSPCDRPAAHRRAGLAGARRARPDRRARHRDHTGTVRPDRVPGDGAAARGVHGARAALPADAARAARRPVAPEREARARDRPRRSCGRGVGAYAGGAAAGSHRRCCRC